MTVNDQITVVPSDLVGGRDRPVEDLLAAAAAGFSAGGGVQIYGFEPLEHMRSPRASAVIIRAAASA